MEFKFWFDVWSEANKKYTVYFESRASYVDTRRGEANPSLLLKAKVREQSTVALLPEWFWEIYQIGSGSWRLKVVFFPHHVMSTQRFRNYRFCRQSWRSARTLTRWEVAGSVGNVSHRCRNFAISSLTHWINLGLWSSSPPERVAPLQNYTSRRLSPSRQNVRSVWECNSKLCQSTKRAGSCSDCRTRVWGFATSAISWRKMANLEIFEIFKKIQFFKISKFQNFKIFLKSFDRDSFDTGSIKRKPARVSSTLTFNSSKGAWK